MNDTNPTQPPALQPGQFEYELFVYGVSQNGMLLQRHTANRMAEVHIGTVSRGMHPSGCLARVVSFYLEADPSDGSKGRVIAICERIEQDVPYRPPMEYK